MAIDSVMSSNKELVGSLCRGTVEENVMLGVCAADCTRQQGISKLHDLQHL